MKSILHLLICIPVLLTSCSRKDSLADTTRIIHDQLHGKYKAISSISNDAVDINLDGSASTDILAELPALTKAFSNLEILIQTKEKFLLCAYWPQQDLGYGVPPNVAVNYVNQGTVRLFTLKENNNEILVKPDEAPLDPERFPFPSSVTIEGPDLIKIVLDRKLYTSKGWITTTITTVYQRFTMET
jgi:hypothetical protein